MTMEEDASGTAIEVDEVRMDCMVVRADGKAVRPRLRTYRDPSDRAVTGLEIEVGADEASGGAEGKR